MDGLGRYHHNPAFIACDRKPPRGTIGVPSPWTPHRRCMADPLTELWFDMARVDQDRS